MHGQQNIKEIVMNTMPRCVFFWLVFKTFYNFDVLKFDI